MSNNFPGSQLASKAFPEQTISGTTCYACMLQTYTWGVYQDVHNGNHGVYNVWSVAIRALTIVESGNLWYKLCKVSSFGDPVYCTDFIARLYVKFLF